MSKPLSKIIKEYPKRGPMQQFRIESATAFHCFRCRAGKTSKLLTVYASDWAKTLCNGCYGRLLSIFDIKKGTQSDDAKADSLAQLLLSLITEDQARSYLEKIRISAERRMFLSPAALRFITTSFYVSDGLLDDANLDWSPAVIGLCKAFEVELIERVFKPLKERAKEVDLQTDINDKDLGKIARFCSDNESKPPELGSITYFFQVAANSKERIQTSPLLRTLIKLTSKWPKADWLFNKAEGLLAIPKLANDFRNKAAHIEDLCRKDFEDCVEFVTGEKGILWHLIAATEESSFVL